MSKVWFTSDPHYFHKNISGPKVSSWKSGYRNFENEIEMSRHIVKVWNQTVAEDDILYCLGDWCFQGSHNIWNFRKQLRCKTIHLCLGNHDEHIRKNARITDKEGNEICFAQDLFTSIQDVLQVKHGNHEFFLSHYSHQVWNGSHKGLIHLFGHSHDSIKGIGKSMDVGIDSAKRILGEYRPFSIEEVIQLMNKIPLVLVDHHNEKTT